MSYKTMTCPGRFQRSVLLPLLVLLTIQVHVSMAKKVVFFSAPHASYVRTHGNVARYLTSMGHDVYVCMPKFIIQERKIDLDGFKVIPYGENLGSVGKNLIGDMLAKFWTKELDLVMTLSIIANASESRMKEVLTDAKFMKGLKDLNADIFVMTHFPFVRGFNVVPYALHKPFVLMGPYYDPHLLRIPQSLASLHFHFNEDFQLRDMTFLQRLKNSFYQFVTFAIFSSLSVDKYLDLLKGSIANKTLPRVTYPELILKSEINLIEGDHVLDYPRPTLPNTVLIGGTAPSKAKPLEEPFKSFIEGSKEDIVLITFGSAIIDIPDQKVLFTMLGAFSRFKQNVVWRGNVASPNPKKILISTWVPQNDILAQKNVKLFISHCGANGNYEALFHAVPMLCLPFDGDQFFNAKRNVDRGFGLRADIRELTEKDWTDLVEELIGNASYAENIQKASRLYRELYKNPVKTAAYWIDHVLEHGGTYMRSAGQEMPLYQYLMLDIAAFAAVVVGMVAWLLWKLCGILWKLICGERSETWKMKWD